MVTAFGSRIGPALYDVVSVWQFFEAFIAQPMHVWLEHSEHLVRLAWTAFDLFAAPTAARKLPDGADEPRLVERPI